MVDQEELERIVRTAVQEAVRVAMEIPREEASSIAGAAARMAVNEAHVKLFAHLGYDMANKDDIKRMRSNLDFIEHLRLGSSTVAKAVVTAIATGFILGLLGLIWMGAKLSVAPHYAPIK